MIHGTFQILIVNDVTDIIGIRTLVLSRFWQGNGQLRSMEEIDAQKPSAPSVSAGVMLIGEQTRRDGGGMRTTWTYQGINGDGRSVTFKDRTNSIDYGFEPGFSQVPIQRHPDFQALQTTYGGWPDTDGQRVYWPPKYAGSSGSGGLSTVGKQDANPMFGVNDYFRTEGTYRFRYAALELPPKVLDGAGKVWLSGLPGQPPELVEKRNWLMLPVRYRRRGTIYDITEEYWLSGPGGWPTPVYGDIQSSGAGNGDVLGGAHVQGYSSANGNPWQSS